VKITQSADAVNVDLPEGVNGPGITASGGIQWLSRMVELHKLVGYGRLLERRSRLYGCGWRLHVLAHQAFNL
jgi:hypothetical protein